MEGSLLQQVNAPVVWNRPLSGDYWLIEVEAPTIARPLTPGQFVNIGFPGSPPTCVVRSACIA